MSEHKMVSVSLPDEEINLLIELLSSTIAESNEELEKDDLFADEEDREREIEYMLRCESILQRIEDASS